jgi:hypothetical protein
MLGQMTDFHCHGDEVRVLHDNWTFLDGLSNSELLKEVTNTASTNYSVIDISDTPSYLECDTDKDMHTPMYLASAIV